MNRHGGWHLVLRFAAAVLTVLLAVLYPQHCIADDVQVPDSQQGMALAYGFV
jgi:hypothetical protein